MKKLIVVVLLVLVSLSAAYGEDGKCCKKLSTGRIVCFDPCPGVPANITIYGEETADAIQEAPAKAMIKENSKEAFSWGIYAGMEMAKAASGGIEPDCVVVCRHVPEHDDYHVFCLTRCADIVASVREARASKKPASSTAP